MPDRRSSAQLSSEPLSIRRELFRTVLLNAVGRAAVAGICATGAAVGLLTTRRTNASPWITGPAGAAAAFAALLAADRRQWGNVVTSHSWTDDVAEVRHMAGRLEGEGVDAFAITNHGYEPTLHYRHRDHRRVARAFRDAGLRPPRRC